MESAEQNPDKAQIGKGQTPLSWQAPEFLEKQRKSDWYWALGIVSLSIAVTAVILNNILFAVFIVVAFVSIIIHSRIKPSIIEIGIFDDGVAIGGNFWPHSSLSSFWIEDFFNERRIIFGTKSIVNPTVYVLLPESANEDEIRSFLSARVAEKKTEESLSEKLMEYLGF